MLTLSRVEWRFVVDAGKYKTVISQRKDGPFAKDVTGGKGHYYVSLEYYAGDGNWRHVAQSTSGAWHSLEEAENIMNSRYKCKD